MAYESSTESSRSKASYWRQHLTEWSGSGMSQAEYCRRSGISLSSFHYWKRRLDRRTPSTKDRAIVAVPFPISSSPVSLPQKPLMLHVGSCFRIEIDQDFCPEVLEKLVVTLERLS